MTLLERTAEAIYIVATATNEDPLPYAKVPATLREHFERMAATALTVAYREPVLVEA